MTDYNQEDIKPEIRGEYGFGIARDIYGNHYPFIGRPAHPLSNIREDFERWNSEVIRTYEGLNLDKIFELIPRTRELDKKVLSIDDLDAILLKKGK